MAKMLILVTILMILSLFIFTMSRRLTSSISHHHSFSTKLSAKAMAPLKNEKLTHLHFYYHNLLAGPNITAVPLNPKGPLDLTDPAGLFGRLTVTDNPMTMGPELSSTTVGSARGMYGVASRTEVAFAMMLTFVFTDDEYRGSTICVLGYNPILADGLKEMPVVGGSGVFRFARGYGDTKLISLNATTGNAVVEWDLYVFHY